jgi:sugar lactone lactonase YvrE
MAAAIRALPGVEPSLLGESPLWHPAERVLYWCDIAGKLLNRFDPRTEALSQWGWDTEPASVAPLLDGGLLVACRDGLWRLEPTTGERERVAPAPYDGAEQRFNDGKADPQGRFWVGTLDEPRRPHGAMYRFAGGALKRVFDGFAISNGLAWSPDGATMYWCDTPTHEVAAFAFDRAAGTLSSRRTFARFAPPVDGEPLDGYGGRPDGAAVDSEGGYWVAMYEGARLVRLGPDGAALQEIALPVRCPTMPCFGGADLKTLYVTTARAGRPADELERWPLSGCVLALKVDVAGLPANFARR